MTLVDEMLTDALANVEVRVQTAPESCRYRGEPRTPFRVLRLLVESAQNSIDNACRAAERTFAERLCQERDVLAPAEIWRIFNEIGSELPSPARVGPARHVRFRVSPPVEDPWKLEFSADVNGPLHERPHISATVVATKGSCWIQLYGFANDLTRIFESVTTEKIWQSAGEPVSLGKAISIGIPEARRQARFQSHG